MKALLSVVFVSSVALTACGDAHRTADRVVTAATDGAKASGPATTAVAAGVDGGYQYYGNGDYQGPELPVLVERQTAGGIRLSLRPLPAGDMSMPVSPSGWTAPGWCYPSGMFRLSVINGDAVGVLSGPIYSALFDGRSVVSLGTGFAEGSPTRVVAVQVDGDVAQVAAAWSDGATDTAGVADGWAVLAVPGEPAADFELTLTGPSGSRTLSATDAVQPGNSLEWQKACTEPAAVLPPAGVQPADAAAAEQQIRDRFAMLWDRSVAFSDKGNDLLNDTTGVADALKRVNNGSFADAVKSAQHTLTGLVFVSPSEAWFSYDITTSMMNFPGKFGVARLTDGRWVFDRGVICQDIALATDACIPAVQPLLPPKA